MYLAPLNYDRYFKKVFSDTNIAKRFLEDFFDVTIESIELLTLEHKITDDSVAVEFDFRCQIDGQMVIIDMQQWYKPDIIHRFYTYHCVSTALQLEKMPLKSMIVEGTNTWRKAKDYSQILPVITLVWMVDDTFGFKDDYVAYTMTPEIVLDFIQNHLLWENPDVTQILKERESALQQLSNKKRNLDFLQKNRLIYVFQKNIVRNAQKAETKYHKYLDWFELAEKTRNKLNQKSDFLKYEEDQIFSQLIRRLSTETLTEKDWMYIGDTEELSEEVNRWKRTYINEGREDGYYEGKEKGIEIGINKKAKEMAIKLIDKGMSNEDIIEITDLSLEDIEQLRNELRI